MEKYFKKGFLGIFIKFIGLVGSWKKIKNPFGQGIIGKIFKERLLRIFIKLIEIPRTYEYAKLNMELENIF